ncbi:hypothetical protein FYK55_05325 [Roseiconus nitratireducens]|uniref:Uncharacterized protein n=1 Tax=Roseiconus nitratireducens TaxID=2605748 RepID=A0A5M6DIJ0_9BACT|nr:hypothetical protein [Roseiconus nitratireducens]KAA5545105.1 hypothetical protein FYK55_05325 [Roseiconus nitratireducens]
MDNTDHFDPRQLSESDLALLRSLKFHHDGPVTQWLSYVADEQGPWSVPLFASRPAADVVDALRQAVLLDQVARDSYSNELAEFFSWVHCIVSLNTAAFLATLNASLLDPNEHDFQASQRRGHA